MTTQNNSKKGKLVEYYIISELLNNDFDVFVPIVDTGIDMIIKSKKAYVEIQVKSRLVKSGGTYFGLKDLKPNDENFFIICHNITNKDFYVIPAKYFYKKSKERKVKGSKIERDMTFNQIKKCDFWKNEKGIELLEKALLNPNNTLLEIQKAIEKK